MPKFGEGKIGIYQVIIHYLEPDMNDVKNLMGLGRDKNLQRKHLSFSERKSMHKLRTPKWTFTESQKYNILVRLYPDLLDMLQLTHLELKYISMEHDIFEFLTPNLMISHLQFNLLQSYTEVNPTEFNGASSKENVHNIAAFLYFGIFHIL